MAARITTGDLTGLAHRHAAFVIEYMKDFDAACAAERSGFERSYGAGLRKMPEVDAAITRVMEHRLEISNIDAQWLLGELVDNHILARQAGKLSASNTALRTIAQHASVDAFAAEKVHIASDEAIRERILRGRRRRGDKEEPPSFL